MLRLVKNLQTNSRASFIVIENDYKFLNFCVKLRSTVHVVEDELTMKKSDFSVKERRRFGHGSGVRARKILDYLYYRVSLDIFLITYNIESK